MEFTDGAPVLDGLSLAVLNDVAVSGYMKPNRSVPILLPMPSLHTGKAVWSLMKFLDPGIAIPASLLPGL